MVNRDPGIVGVGQDLRAGAQARFRRVAVYDAIDGERDYQNDKWSEDTTESGGRHTMAEWLSFVADYVNEAMHFYARNPDPEATDFMRHTARKIAALAVSALEEHGPLTRFVEGGRPVGFSE